MQNWGPATDPEYHEVNAPPPAPPQPDSWSEIDEANDAWYQTGWGWTEDDSDWQSNATTFGRDAEGARSTWNASEWNWWERRSGAADWRGAVISSGSADSACSAQGATSSWTDWRSVPPSNEQSPWEDMS